MEFRRLKLRFISAVMGLLITPVSDSSGIA